METHATQNSRGCSFKCSFCTFKRDLDGRNINYTTRSTKLVADELATIDADYVVFMEDNVCQDIKRMDYLCDLITERGTCKTYGIETRTNLAFYPDVAAKVTRAGFRHVTFSLEAIHNHPLEFLNKAFKRHTNENAFTAIRHLPMLFISNFTARNVGETREPMLEIPYFARKIGLDFIMVNHLRCRGPELLTKTVLATAGHHIDEVTRKVYSDDLGLEDIRQTIKQIKRNFWAPQQQLQTGCKVQRLLKPLRLYSIARHWGAGSYRAVPMPGESARISPPAGHAAGFPCHGRFRIIRKLTANVTSVVFTGHTNIQISDPIITGFQQRLNGHHVYRAVSTIEDLRCFMQHHIYSVWDFMSLIKYLQGIVAPTTWPWLPADDTRVQRFINKLVLEEESDSFTLPGTETEHSLSHFQLYCAAMREVGADDARPRAFVEHIRSHGIETALASDLIPGPSRDFTRTTFDFLASGKPHVVAAALAIGREHVIPGMFRALLAGIGISGQDAPMFHVYLYRHIHLDEDFHAPLSLRLLESLCDGEETRVAEALEAAERAITARLAFWDGVVAALGHDPAAVTSA